MTIYLVIYYYMNPDYDVNSYLLFVSWIIYEIIRSINVMSGYGMHMMIL